MRTRSRIWAVCALAGIGFATAAQAQEVVISQIFPGAGCKGARCSAYHNDYVELFNKGATPATVSGWSVQYASATGTNWSVAALPANAVIPPGGYFLVKLEGNTNGLAELPEPDATGNLNLSASAGKIALVKSTTALSGTVTLPNPNIADFVGYGSTASIYEGTGRAPAPGTNYNAIFRKGAGCQDSNDNAADFEASAAAPRNSASTPAPCGSSTNLSATLEANPNPVPAGTSVSLTVTVTPGTNPPSTGITVVGDLSALGGSASQAFTETEAGSNVFTFTLTIPAEINPGPDNVNRSVSVTVTDAQSRSGSAQATVTVRPSNASIGGQVVISQVYGGGGNSGAEYKHDFVELFNRSTVEVDLNGWSIQYRGATGDWSSVIANLTGTIAPGGYYLVQLAAGSGGTLDLPTPDAIGNIMMGASNGVVVLVASTEAQTGCPTGSQIIDLVGYGTATCSEEASTGALSNTTAAIRKDGGCVDTDNNALDFIVGPPSPRNSASPTHECSIGDSLNGFLGATPNPVAAGDMVTVTIAVSGGTPAYTVQGDLTAIGGTANQAFYDDGTHGDVTSGDAVFTFEIPVPCTTAPGTKTIHVIVTDSGSNTLTRSIDLTVNDGTVAIGEVFETGDSGYDDGQPRNATRCVGETATFSVFARGGNLSYQWYNASGPLSDGGKISGATSDTLRISNVQPEDANAGPYYCIVSGCGGSQQSNAATLTIGSPASAHDKQVIISQVYGGGGNAGSTYTHDFIELFNMGTTPVDLTGWSVQYASTNASGISANFDRPARITLLSGVIQPGKFFLIQEAKGNGGTTALPFPDVDGTTQTNGGIAIGSSGGKVALVKATTPLAEMGPYGNGPAPTACSIVDFVGWGNNVGCAEGGNPAPGTSNTTAVVRKLDCVSAMDTDNNGNDFVVADPLPHNSASSTAAAILTQPSDQFSCPGTTATFSVVADGLCLTSYRWQVNTGSGWVDVTTGTGFDTPSYTTPILSPEDDGNQYRCVVSNAQSTAISEPATLSTRATESDKQIVITQLYVGGGNANAVYENDFIELFNKGTTAVDLSGWSVQYASATGGTWNNKIDLSGTIEPGKYYLIRGQAGTGCNGSACGDPLPVTPDAISTINMSATAGKIALVKSVEQLGGTCPLDDCRVIDFVGFGSTASCYEGAIGKAPVGDNTQAIFRKGDCTPQDTDDNAGDFEVGPANPRNSASTACGPCKQAPWADADKDGDVDQADFGAFQACFNGEDTSGLLLGTAYACECFDRAGTSGAVDEVDLERFEQCASDSGPAIPWNPANPACSE